MHPCSREATVDIAVTTSYEVVVGGAQVAVEEGVNERVDERVGVAQPQQRALYPEGHAAALGATNEGPRCGQQEKGQPAHSECAHHNTKRGRRLLLSLEDGNALVVVTTCRAQKAGQARAVFHLALQL